MRKNNQTAIAAYPEWHEQTGRFAGQINHDLSPRPESTNVIHGTNEPSPARTLIFGFVVLTMPFVIASVSLWLLSEWPRLIIIAVSIVGMLYSGPISFIVANGDWSAWRQMINNRKVEIHRQNNLLALHTQNMNNDLQKAKWQHIENMQQIDNDKVVTEVLERLRLIEAGAGDFFRLHRENGAVADDRAASPTYIPARVSPIRARVMGYLLGSADASGLYTREGRPNSNLVGEDGRLMYRAPFSKRGEWGARDSVDAMNILSQEGTGNPPIIMEVPGGYALNVRDYPTRARVIRTLGLA